MRFTKVFFGVPLILIASISLNGQVKNPVLSGKERVSLNAKQTEMRGLSPFRDLKWQYVGPTNISGRCTDVEAVSPRGENYIIWVGSATGGVWKSTNEGTTFEPVFDAMATASIGDIAIDPANKDVVYIKPVMAEKHGPLQDSRIHLQLVVSGFIRRIQT